MAKLLEQIGAELSIFRDQGWTCSWNETLHYCQTEIEYDRDAVPYRPQEDDHFLHDLLMKMLRCGRRPNCTYPVESLIVETYGEPFKIKRKTSRVGSIAYDFQNRLIESCQDFTDVADPWVGKSEEVDFDPDHPKNERFMFNEMLNFFDQRLAHFIKPQVPLEEVLPRRVARDFIGQRGDFLISFPNGRSLLLEPGDHDDGSQKNRDRLRDKAFSDAGIQTLRPRNAELKQNKFYEQLQRKLEELDAVLFLKPPNSPNSSLLSENYLFLLPTLIARTERLFSEFFFRHGLVHKEHIKIEIIERDLECAEIALGSFLDRVIRLCALYGIDLKIPKIRLSIKRNSKYRYGDLSEIQKFLNSTFDQIEFVYDRQESPDLILDLAVKCNELTASWDQQGPLKGVSRNTFHHNRPVEFSYSCLPKSVSVTDDLDEKLSAFLRDIFRKEQLRTGQVPIIKNILQQKSTVGLLPTSAGKSICYQLASLLTPGVSFVIDPLVALMNDQVQGLTGNQGIDRCFAWKGSDKVDEEQAGEIIRENLIVFLTPERFQRPAFRSAMKSLGASDVFVNYAVIDEAHCVSMWGHDFRNSYLLLEKNIRSFCSMNGNAPVFIALTGTASQMVLIDLQRELNIQGSSDIVRPKTFNRPELVFHIHRCGSSKKQADIRFIEKKIQKALNLYDLDTEGYGIIFIPTLNACWQTYSSYVGKAEEVIKEELDSEAKDSPYGIYTGGPPPLSGFRKQEWDQYKEVTLRRFKQGKVKKLIGTSAISTGIDNPYLNYIINTTMPNSLELFYQQSGRAGRSGQESHIYTLFSDDQPDETLQWLRDNKSIEKRARDDIGTLAFFHKNSFPGIEVDSKGAELILNEIIHSKEVSHGVKEIPQYVTDETPKAVAERTERYLSFMLILGVISDYEIIGAYKNTTYRVQLENQFSRYLSDENNSALLNHFKERLIAYRSRYQPQQRMFVESDCDESDQPWNIWGIQHLVSFVYEKIESRRREQMLTMHEFLSQEDSSPDQIRNRISNYFDGNPKFVDALDRFQDELIPGQGSLSGLIKLVEGYEDVESLIWMARSRLDEGFQIGGAAVYLYSLAYRNHWVITPEFDTVFDQLVSEWLLLNEKSVDHAQWLNFMAEFLMMILDPESVKDNGGFANAVDLIIHCLCKLPTEYKIVYESMDISLDIKALINTGLVSNQLREIVDGRYTEVLG